jgi:hypothetical protein
MEAQDTIRKVDLNGLAGMRFYGISGDEYVWTGRNHTINVYGPDGVEYDVMSVGDFAKDAATMDEVLGAIARRESNDE